MIGNACYGFGPYLLETAQWRLRRGEDVVALPPKAFALLRLLVERAGHLVAKEEILAAVWEGTFVEESNVAFYVAMLRKALADPPGHTYIETVKKRGYRFVAPVVVHAEPGESALEPEPALPVAPAAPLVEPSPEVGATPEAKGHRTSHRFLGLSVALAAGFVFGLAWFTLSARDASIRSIVVMPFRAIAPDVDRAYLESGMAESIAMRLGDVPSLRVLPLAAVRRDEGPFEAGQRLRADAVLTGTVQRSGNRLLVSAQLSRVGDGERLWAWSFDTTSGEILHVQGEIGERIATRLGRELTTSDRVPLTRRETASGEAYDLFLQAREQWKWRTPHSVQQAIGLYERAIEIDPQFPRAYAGLADCYNLAMSGLPPTVRYPLAKANAEKAVALDPDSAEARTSLAFLRYKFEWRWQEADVEFKRALTLNPRYALAHHWYGEFLGLMGRQDEAIAELKNALELDPLSLAIRGDMVPPLLRAGRLTDARAILDDGLKLDPNWYWFPMRMAEIFAVEGRDRESAEATWRAMTLRGVPLNEVDELRAAFEKGGTAEMTRAQIRQYLSQEVTPTSPASFGIATNLSLAYGRLGDAVEAMRWLETAIERREDAVIHMLTNPAYDVLRSEPRFLELLDQLGLKLTDSS